MLRAVSVKVDVYLNGMKGKDWTYVCLYQEICMEFQSPPSHSPPTILFAPLRGMDWNKVHFLTECALNLDNILLLHWSKEKCTDISTIYSLETTVLTSKFLVYFMVWVEMMM